MPDRALSRLARSRLNYWTGYAVDVGGIALFLSLGLGDEHWSASGAGSAGVAGYCAWTLWEYGVHRYLFHKQWSPLLHDHLAHHAAPRSEIGLPFFVGFVIALLLLGACRLIMPPPYPYFFVAGAYAGWLYYGILHHVEHATDLSLRPYRRLRRHHQVHHASMVANFGVSTTIWDRLFGTHRGDLSRETT